MDKRSEDDVGSCEKWIQYGYLSLKDINKSLDKSCSARDDIEAQY
jgi:hypothetical protein